MRDGNKVLARLPYPFTQPHRLAVASEVATLNLVRLNGVPVPKVLHYSTDSNNEVSAEYIVLEKLPGRPLAERWYDLSETQRLKITLQVVELEVKLSQIVLPAYGSIYYDHDLPVEAARAAISTPHAVEGLCVGPFTALNWWHGEREALSINRGPFSTTLDLLQSIARKEIAWLKTYGQPRFPFEREYRESTGYLKSSAVAHADSLEKFVEIAPYLNPDDPKFHQPVLRHPDLQPNNILCTDDLEITGLIDWQHSIVLPQFLAAGIPKHFANYQDDESLRFVPPQLPDNLNELDGEQQSETLEIYRRRHLHFFYLAFTQRFNPSHLQALARPVDLLTRKTVEHAGQPWEGNNIPLKSDLIHLTQVWQKLVTQHTPDTAKAAPCPLSFSEAEVGNTLASLTEQEEIDTQMEAVRGMIGVGIDGWTSNDEFDDAVARARLVKEQALENLGTDEERKMTSRHRPFDDFNEDE